MEHPTIPPPPPQRRPWPRRLVRSVDDRLIAGVAGGLGRAIGVDPVLVRIAFVVLTMAGGVGLVAYGLLWAVAPAVADRPVLSRRPSLQQAAAVSLVMLGTLLLLRRAGLWFGDGLVWPVVVAAAGSAVVWTRGESRDGRAGPAVRLTSRLEGRSGGVEPVTSLPRVLVGTALVAVALLAFLAGNVSSDAVRDLALAGLAAGAGVLLLFGPWATRTLDELRQERRARVRQEERAALAAHLHDSVLQTLALIQRSDDPRRMRSLARVQERELRSWLYGGAQSGGRDRTLEAAVGAVADEVEARFHLEVESVVVGDVAVDEAVEALLGAVREALVNVAKHAEVATADLYLEVDDQAVTAFVRDRGRGFDPVATEARSSGRGLRDSVHGRLARHGGTATVDAAPGRGTEVMLRLPRLGRADDRAVTTTEPRSGDDRELSP